MVILMLAYFVFAYLSVRDKVTVGYYEVEEGSLVKEHNYTGLILRSEECFPAQANGYIYFSVADGRKTAKGSSVYAIDESGRLMNYLNTHSGELSELNSSKASDIRAELLRYSRGFSNDHFKNLYNIKNTLDARTIEYAGMNVFGTIQSELMNSGIRYNEFVSEKTGIVCCYTDGFEELTEADIKQTMFDRDGYNKVNIKSGDLLKAGDTAYKLVTDENWQIVFPLEAEDMTEFDGKDQLKVSFSDKSFSVKCKYKTITGADRRKYGVLSLSSYVIQFCQERFVDFEIVTNDVSGLKIPVKAITKKDFYVIPTVYLVEDDKGNPGFYKAVQGASGTAAEFVMPEIFNRDDEFCYIECDESSRLSPGDFIMSSPTAAADGTERDTGDEEFYQIGERRSLDGAYNVNKGYAVFKKVEMLESSNGYAIVKKGSGYGLQVYDHIVLDASMVSDGQLLFR